jgi:uncharacterized membrane protein
MKNVTALGRCFFALAAIGSGIQQLVRADFVRLVPKLPAWLPWHPFLACAVGVVLIAAGTAILVGYMSRRGAIAVGALLLVTFVFQRLPEIASNPLAGFMWTNPCKVLALLSGALMLATQAPGEAAAGSDWANKLLPLGPILLGVFLLVCGFQHFYYAGFVDTLVPTWLPQPRFWTYFAGTCLLAGGLGLLIPKTMRWAAIMSGIMVFLWVFLLHIPRAVTMTQDPGETSAIFEALAISGVAFLVAGVRSTESTCQLEYETPAAPAAGYRGPG